MIILKLYSNFFYNNNKNNELYVKEKTKIKYN